MNSKKLFRVAKIKSNDEDVYIIICGHSRACEIEFNTEDEAWEYINEMGLDWDIIITVIAEIFGIINKSKNLK